MENIHDAIEIEKNNPATFVPATHTDKHTQNPNGYCHKMSIIFMYNTVQVCPHVLEFLRLLCQRSLLHLEVFNSHLNLLRSLLEAAAVVVCDGPLVVLGGVYVVCDSRVLVAAVVVAAHLLGVVQELPGKQRLHLKHRKVRQVSERL